MEQKNSFKDIMTTKGIGKRGCSSESMRFLELPQGQKEGLRQILRVGEGAKYT